MRTLFFGLIVWGSCYSCRNETLQSFERLYISLQDSVAHYEGLSENYLAQLAPNNRAERNYALLVSRSIQRQNKHIDSLIQQLSNEAVNLNDRTVSTKYLVETEAAERVQKATTALTRQLAAEHPTRLPEAARVLLLTMNEQSNSDDRPWATQRFQNVPMAVSRAKLQQWKYQNSKAKALILLDLKNPSSGADEEI
jgi:hypothetical protein